MSTQRAICMYLFLFIYSCLISVSQLIAITL